MVLLLLCWLFWFVTWWSLARMVASLGGYPFFSSAQAAIIFTLVFSWQGISSEPQHATKYSRLHLGNDFYIQSGAEAPLVECNLLLPCIVGQYPCICTLCKCLFSLSSSALDHSAFPSCIYMRRVSPAQSSLLSLVLDSKESLATSYIFIRMWGLLFECDLGSSLGRWSHKR